MLKRYIKPLIISVLISACLYAAMIAVSGADEIKPAFEKVPLSALILILALSMLNYLIRFVRWNLFSKKLGYELPVFKHLLYYFSGFALTTTPGKAGEAIRHVYLKPHGYSLRHSLASLFAERLSDLMAMSLLAGLAAVHFANYRILEVGIVLGIIGLLIVLQKQDLIDNIHRRLNRFTATRFHNSTEKLFGLLRSSATLLRSRILATGLILGVVSWGCEGLAFYYLLQILDIPISLWLGVGIYAISVLVGAVSFLPGGLGSTEAVMGLLLVSAGASPANAILATLICRTATIWFAVGLGLLVILWLEYDEPRLMAEHD